MSSDFTTLGRFLDLWLDQHDANSWANTHSRYGYAIRLQAKP